MTEELARISIPIPKQPDSPISYNIAPGQNVLAIRFNPETRERSLDQRWGPSTPELTKTVDKAPSYRQAFIKPHCLIPADGFYEGGKRLNRSCDRP